MDIETENKNARLPSNTKESSKKQNILINLKSSVLTPKLIENYFKEYILTKGNSSIKYKIY